MRRYSIAILCIASLVFTQACASQETSSRAPRSGAELAEDAGLGVGSFLASAVYAPLKLVYATCGLVAGGLAWVLSGADDDVAMRVIGPAVSGDYVITPDHLRDPLAIEFIGPGVDFSRSAIAGRAATAPPSVSSAPPSWDARSAARADAVSVAQMLESCSASVSLPPIRFRYGVDVLDPGAKRSLEVIPSALARCPGSTVRIVGHADASGPSPYNLVLSQQRATAIRDHLVSQGVEASRLQIVAEGESKPVSSNATREGRATNRRAEITLVVR